MTCQFQSTHVNPRFGGGFVLLLLAISLLRAPAAPAEPASAPAAGKTNSVVEIPKSTFDVPATPQDGRNPFFPKSTLLGPIENKTNTISAPRAELVLKGHSGKPEAPLAIIGIIGEPRSDKTFAPGDEADVIMPGVRLHVLCLEIRLNDQIAIVQVNGERRELHFPRRR